MFNIHTQLKKCHHEQPNFFSVEFDRVAFNDALVLQFSDSLSDRSSRQANVDREGSKLVLVAQTQMEAMHTKLEAVAADLAAWESVSINTAFEGMTVSAPLR